jgi:hypothetical protein
MSAPECGAGESLMGLPRIRLTRIDPKPGPLLATTIRLVDGRYPYAFDCPGDDATRCCGFTVDTMVLVHGTFLRRTSRDDPSWLEIDSPLICRFELP